MKLIQRSILITGGNSGIGFALVRQLQSMGNQLLVVTRSQNRWDELVALSPEIVKFQCDVADKEQLLHLREQLKERDYQVDVLINCAAVQYTPKLTDEDFSFDGVQNEVLTNIAAPVWLSYLLLPGLMKPSKAAIINLSSGLAFYPKSSSPVYCASKAALHNFSQSLRYQLADTGVKVSEVILPLVDTPMTAGRGSGKISPQQAAREIIKGIERGLDEIYVGKARMMPLMLRIWPGMMKRILAKY